MEGITINIWAVLVSGAIHWILGALWYSPLLFAVPWAKAKGIDINDPDHGATLLEYLSGLLVGWVLAAVLATVLSLMGVGTVPQALLLTFLLWLGFTCAPLFANAVFGGSYLLWAIDSTYPLASALLMSVLLTLW